MAKTAALEPYPPHERTIPAILRRRSREFPGKPVLRCEGVERSDTDMTDAVAGVAGILTTFGIEPGDRVAVMAENRVELLDLMLACPWAGALAVPINPSLRATGLEHQLSDSGARVLVIADNLLEVLAHVALPSSLEQIWTLPTGDVLTGRVVQGVPVDALPETPGPVADAEVTQGSVAAILYTSGTTGPAKGVLCSHGQFHWWGFQMATQLALGPDDVLYTALPIYHVNAFGAFFQALVSGGIFHLGPRFSASRMVERLIESQATVTYLLGAMVSMLGATAAGDRDRQHRVTRALAPSSSARDMELLRHRFGIEPVEAYGSTETNAAIGAPMGEQRSGWMGPVRDGFMAQVVDEEDNPVPNGEVGELVLRATEPFSFSSGYFQAPDKTVEAWRNLWFHTGDQVERSPDGWYRFHGRLSDSIRRRGENISSFEVEAVLGSHAEVEQVAAYALPSDLGEDEVAVAVMLSAGSTLDEASLIRWCEPRLAYFAIPRYLRFLKELPLTENGKVRKAALRDEGTDECWDREDAGVLVSWSQSGSKLTRG